MFVPSPAIEQEFNQTLAELHLFVRDELFPEIDVPGSIKYDGGLDADKLDAIISDSYAGEIRTANVTINYSGRSVDNYAIRIGPGSALAGARTMARHVAHELGHVARHLELFGNHPSTPTVFLAAWYKLRRYFTNEERRVDELCKSRGLEKLLKDRWPAKT